MAIAGRVAMIPKGDYDSATTYQILDVVRYNDAVYVAKKASTGIPPTNTDYWMLMTQDGLLVDDEFDEESENPVQNKVVSKAISDILNGTTPAGNSLKLGGKGASEYALSKDFFRGDNYAYMESGDTNELYRLQLQNGTVKVYKTTDDGVSWTDLGSVSDGGNADTVNGQRAAELLSVRGDRGVINPVSNLNDFITGIGLFGGDCINIPSADWWFIVSGGTSGTVTQIAFKIWNNEVSKMRRCAAGTWEDWEDINVGLANYLPIDGSKAMIEPFLFASGNGAIHGDGNHVSIGATNVPNDYSNQRRIMVMNSTYVPNMKHALQFWDTVNGNVTPYIILHQGNLSDHAIPISGGMIINPTEPRMFNLNHTGGLDVYIGLYNANGYVGALGTDGVEPKWFRMSDHSFNTLHHDGNSAKVVQAASAPSNADVIWYDTVNKTWKRYVDGAWQA